MKALSIRQPWAWLIVNGYKNIENRTWLTKVRGEILVHAGLKIDKDGYEWVSENFPHIKMPALYPGCDITAKHQFEVGGIVGLMNIIACVTDSPSPWFFGPVGFEIAGAQPLPFRPYKGKLGFFDVPVGEGMI